MKAGLIGRRLTSNAPSNPDIRNILRSLDDATVKLGGTEASVADLQDFYNILTRYYDIKGQTALAGQVGLGVEQAKGIKEVIAQSVRETVGVSDDVKRQLLEDAILEALK